MKSVKDILRNDISLKLISFVLALIIGAVLFWVVKDGNNLSQSASQIDVISAAITAFISAVIVGVAFYYLIKIFKYRSFVNDDFKKALDQLKICECDDPIQARINFYDNFDDLNDEFKKLSHIKHPWEEFCEHLILPVSQSCELEDRVIKNTILPEEFFSSDFLLSNDVDPDICNNLPGILTGLGVLGTFVGFTVGISQLDPSSFNENTGKLLEGITGLLGGAKTAFITSVFGVLFSIIFTIIEKRTNKKTNKLINDFIIKLDKCLLFTTEVKQQEELIEHIKQLKNNSDSLVNDLSTKISESLDQTLLKLQDLLVQKLQEQRANDNSELIAGIGSALGKALDNQAEVIAGNISSKMQTVFDIQANRSSEDFKNLNHALSKQAEVIAENISSKIEDVFDKQADRNKDDFRILSNELADKMQNAVQTSLKETVSSAVTGFNDSMKKVNNVVGCIEKSFGEINKVQCNTMENMAKQVTDSLNGEFKNVSTQFITSCGDLVEKIESSSGKYYETTQQLIISSQKLNDLVKNLNQSCSHIDNVVNDQRLIIERERDVMDKHQIIANNLQQFSAQYTSLANDMRNIAANVSNFNNAESSRQERIVEMWRKYEQRFATIDSEFEKFVDKMVTGNQQILGQYEGAINRLSAATKEIASMMSQHINELGEIFEDNKIR